MVHEILISKKDKFAVEAKQLKKELCDFLNLKIENVRIVNRYLVDGIDETTLNSAIKYVFADTVVDEILFKIPASDFTVAVELMPGQFDARATSAIECIKFLNFDATPEVLSSKIYLIDGPLSNDDIEKCKKYLINPVEAREASLLIPNKIDVRAESPKPVEIENGFCKLNKNELEKLILDKGFSFDLDDALLIQQYFTQELRDPTVAELQVIDTYWSDHCRHTTFNTHITDVEIEDVYVRQAYERYLDLRKETNRADSPITFMDIGTIAARVLKQRNILKNLDESDEINACTVKIKVDVDGEIQDWLYLFKNETHNHPTEIEPFGGAATCLGGAIRDPLSGRAYVYQAMRVSGSDDPRKPFDQTIKGKLTQRQICINAAKGYSSYGNQIGLNTGFVDEIYHPGFAAKRLEIGAVTGAAPACNVVRKAPKKGDVVILIGGKTGRDGIGGATGSSKAHNISSIETCGSEVQKGNPITERKIQRLFRKKEATKMIVKCNDFGAGGVSVAVGELADSIDIELDKMPKKYEGLSGAELAISESQERMACVIEPENVNAFIKLTEEENLEATIIAHITDSGRLIETFNGQEVVNIKRDFLNSFGATKKQSVKAEKLNTLTTEILDDQKFDFESELTSLVCNLNVCSKKGLMNLFDSSIGKASITSPYGGKNKLTPALSMISKLPVLGKTTTVSAMAYGFNPKLTSKNPYVGAYFAVVDSIAKLIASGFARKNVYLTFQEYFKKLNGDATRFGAPLSALLGALDAQMALHCAAIGGKDSMSGSFEDMDVPPTLVSFATAIGNENDVITPELKEANSAILMISPKYDNLLPNADSLKFAFDLISDLNMQNKIISASTPAFGGAIDSLFKMTLGNSIGIVFNHDVDMRDLFKESYGSFILEIAQNNLKNILEKIQDDNVCEVKVLGNTTSDLVFQGKDFLVELDEICEKWTSVLDSIYSTNTYIKDQVFDIKPFNKKEIVCSNHKISKPKIAIPIFPGTNCEYDLISAFEEAGGVAQTFVLNNLNPQKIQSSIDDLARLIDSSQILMLPGGFSGGDEPDGSAKMIACILRNSKISESIMNLINKRDGLILGICNGFQALLKSGLLPYGEICDVDEILPTLTFNEIAHHQSCFVNTRIMSNLSPWLFRHNVNDIHTIPVSHGEGRFCANIDILKKLENTGQIACVYCDIEGNINSNISINPNGSDYNIEAISSPDGRILGKMAHSERRGESLYKNISGNKFQEIFEGGIDYFKI